MIYKGEITFQLIKYFNIFQMLKLAYQNKLLGFSQKAACYFLGLLFKQTFIV
jgi:hypothetical protein